MKKLSRRALLRGIGGAAVALPLMTSTLGRQVFAQTGGTAPSGFPKRFIYFVHPNGTVQDSFWPTAGSSERDFTLSPILAPMEGGIRTGRIAEPTAARHRRPGGVPASPVRVAGSNPEAGYDQGASRNARDPL